MNEKEIRELADEVAPIIAATVARELKDSSIQLCQDHERVLRGKNGDIGLIARVFNLEINQKRILAIFSIIGVAILTDTAMRLWSFVSTLP